MKPQNVVEFADQLSRRRALGIALATVAFLGVQLVARPVFRSDGYGASGPRAYMWALNAAALLLLLLPAGGFIWGRRVRELVNDEVSRANARTGAAAGFWMAMAAALAVYAVAASRALSAREAAYVVVTPATAVALLAFAWLESRAHRDG
ncbi:MAG TPA: hypothetical protein VKA84_26655 [Gemmatimonadaceae bacterium]|nr:hypothetical protein [Gemmatimonadaceae bacterium]